MSKLSFNKCDICGRFISFDDLQNGKATHKMLTPDSDYSHEEWETLCLKHTEKERILQNNEHK